MFKQGLARLPDEDEDEDADGGVECVGLLRLVLPRLLLSSLLGLLVTQSRCSVEHWPLQRG